MGLFCGSPVIGRSDGRGKGKLPRKDQPPALHCKILPRLLDLVNSDHTVYRVGQKVNPKYAAHNFVKY